jgi:hypothetical protein
MHYTFLVTHKTTGIRYYGSRTSNNKSKIPEEDLWVKYFTSSKIVKALIEKEGKETFTPQIRKTFLSKDKCLLWEAKVLRRLKVHQNKNYFNMDTNQLPHKAIQNVCKVTSIYDPSTDIMMRWPKNKPLPVGFHIGARPVSETEKSKISKRRWFHNENGLAVFCEKCPNGYKPGRGPKYQSNSNTLKSKKRFWITNGKDSKLVDSSYELGVGWYKGRNTESVKRNIRKDFEIWNDGKKNYHISKRNPIPNGLVKGSFVRGRGNKSRQIPVVVNNRDFMSIVEAAKYYNTSTYLISKNPTFKRLAQGPN